MLLHGPILFLTGLYIQLLLTMSDNESWLLLASAGASNGMLLSRSRLEGRSNVQEGGGVLGNNLKEEEAREETRLCEIVGC